MLEPTFPYFPTILRLSIDRICMSKTLDRIFRPACPASIRTSDGCTRSVFLLVTEATITTGEWWFMRSGERIIAGRCPACSDPSTGSSRTRTTSPRFWASRGASCHVLTPPPTDGIHARPRGTHPPYPCSLRRRHAQASIAAAVPPIRPEVSPTSHFADPASLPTRTARQFLMEGHMSS